MSLPSWVSWLKLALNQPTRKQPLRLAVLGIGHELRGDDAAGMAVARGLTSLTDEHVLVIPTGHAPENHTGTVRRFKPTLVLLVDAAQMHEAPGTIRCFSIKEITGLSASTHTMPLHLLARFLQAETGCEVVVLGIQPADTTIGEALTEAVQMAVDTITQTIKDLWLEQLPQIR